MTIGPEPMTRTALDVVALGHYLVSSVSNRSLLSRGLLGRLRRGFEAVCPSGGDDHVPEAVEEVVGVVRAGGRLGVVLHREGRDVERPQALDDVVVEPDVAHLDAAVAVRAVELALDRGLDGEAVVVRGDLDAAGGLVEHRLVDAAVSERQLVGAEPERAAEQLVAEADAEERQSVVEHAAQQLHVVARGGGVAGTVGVEDRDRVDRTDAVDRDVLRQHVHVEAACGEVVDRRLLDAEVEHREVADPLRRRRGDLGGRDGDRRGEVQPGHLRRLADESQLLVGGEGGGIPREDSPAHAAGRADVARDGAGVDAADAHDAVAHERVVERLVGAPVRHDARRVAHDVPRHPDAPGLRVLVVHAGVADVRRGLQHDLTGVRGIREGLLVAGHAGGEDDLAEGRAARAVGAADVAGAVLEHEDGGVGVEQGGHASLPVWVGVRMPRMASARARAEASCGRK